MEKRKNKVLSAILMFGLISQSSYAGIGDSFNKYIGSEFSNASGFYIILGVIAAGVVGKICQRYFMVEEEKPVSKVKISQHSHQRHHRHRNIIKKTS